MSRFPPIPPSAQTAGQQVAHEEMDSLTQKAYGSTFTLKNGEGALLGPFATLLYSKSLSSPLFLPTPHTSSPSTSSYCPPIILTEFANSSSYTPTLASPWLKLAHGVVTFPALSDRERELAVLAVLSHTRAAYALYAHTRIAEAAGLSPSQVSEARSGSLPSSLSEREEAAYSFALQLAHMNGPMDDEVFARAQEVFGRDGVAALMHTTGSFLYSSVLFNAADICLPEGEKI